MVLLHHLRGFDVAVGDILQLVRKQAAGESHLDLLLCEGPVERAAFFFVAASGARAGEFAGWLPADCRGTNYGVSVNWLLDNWPSWFAVAADAGIEAWAPDLSQVLDRHSVVLIDRDDGPAEALDAVAALVGTPIYVEALKSLLRQEPGTSHLLADLAPRIGPAMHTVRASWNWLNAGDYRISMTFLEPSSLRTVVFARTDADLKRIGWKWPSAGSGEAEGRA